MNQRFKVHNKNHRYVIIIAKDEEDAKDYAKTIGHVKKPENAIVNKEPMYEDLEVFQKLLSTGIRGSLITHAYYDEDTRNKYLKGFTLVSKGKPLCEFKVNGWVEWQPVFPSTVSLKPPNIGDFI